MSASSVRSSTSSSRIRAGSATVRRITHGVVGTVLSLVAGVGAVSPGEASEGRLHPAGGAKVVIVWRNAKAQDEGTALIRAGVNKTDPSRLLPFIACIVPPGTKAVTTTPRIFSHDIKVVEGEHTGCVGNVPTEVFKRQ
jgi:hypothetical protein